MRGGWAQVQPESRTGFSGSQANAGGIACGDSEMKRRSMKVTHVRVSAGCTLPHPHESYANIKLFAELTAELTVRDDPHEVVAGLQDEVNVLLSNERAKTDRRF